MWNVLDSILCLDSSAHLIKDCLLFNLGFRLSSFIVDVPFCASLVSDFPIIFYGYTQHLYRFDFICSLLGFGISSVTIILWLPLTVLMRFLKLFLSIILGIWYLHLSLRFRLNGIILLIVVYLALWIIFRYTWHRRSNICSSFVMGNVSYWLEYAMVLALTIPSTCVFYWKENASLST